MKKILFLLLIIPLVFACEDPKEVEPFKLDTDATIRLIPASSTKSTRSATLTDLEIVQQATDIFFQWNGETLGRGFSAEQRSVSTTPPFLSMFSGDVVVAETGELNPHFIEAEDVVLVKIITTGEIPFQKQYADTIAYIPNATIRQAEQAIKTAYNGENDTAVYALFMSAYKFIPITGAEWRALENK